MRKGIIVSAGGTGGHIVPALALADEFLKQGYKVSYIGNKGGMEERLAKDKGLEFYPIDVQKLYRNFTFQHLKFPFKLLKSIIQAYRIIKRIDPILLIGTGGFVCGPVGLAAILSKTPLFIQEQNSFPGITTRALSIYAKRVYLGNAGADKFFKRDNTMFSGNPIFKDKLTGNDKIDFEEYGLTKEARKLLIIGGSQGSQFLNELVLKNLDFLQEKGIELIWQSGKNNLEKIKMQIGNKKGIYLFGFTNEMPSIYNSVDFAISRCGALVLAELEVKKIPSILIPLPSSAGNHQYQNALDFQERGLGLLLEQRNVSDFQELFNQMLETEADNRKNFKEALHLQAAEMIFKDIMNRFNE